jgi:hypothetical protein
MIVEAENLRGENAMNKRPNNTSGYTTEALFKKTREYYQLASGQQCRWTGDRSAVSLVHACTGAYL